ncbi:MAG: N-acetylglucosamine-6-phosphate deacetylase [Octadecabacter sp.]|nr:N-acetylglucosamine-6-phosphate deacetylase [Octadecabacter sp.]
MSPITRAFCGAQIFDGADLRDGLALMAQGDGRFAVLPEQAVPDGCPVEALEGGIIAPSFVDLQVNGGGGVMFNDAPSVDTLRRIAQAHADLGTGALLPTLITDSPQATRAAIDAVGQAIAEGVAGIAGLHLEGPHLSVARKGAHDAALIHPMEADDLALLLKTAEQLPNLMVTVAPENVTLAQITAMADAGIIVSLGHTDANMATCHAAFDAGARCVTHLFNAMSQLGSRAPGLVGATLEREEVFAGLIADGVHVHAATVRIALAAKPRSDRVFLVTDAMATAGSQIETFTLGERDIYRKDGRLTLADGTLAGADLVLAQAVGRMTREVGDTPAQALARAITTPASLLRDPMGAGRFCGGAAIYIEDIGQHGPQLRLLRPTEGG